MEAENLTIDGEGVRRQRSALSRRRIPRHTYRGRVQRDLRVDNVRGILIILVVIGHFLLPFSRTRFVTNLIYIIYSFHMPCFVMISGFYAKSACRDGRFRWGKLVQFLWLYLLYKSLVWITEGLLAGNIPPAPDFFHESGAPWYLFALMCWYMTLPLFSRLNRWPLNGAALLIVFLAVVFGKYVVTCGDFLCIDRVLSFAPFFYLGYFCNQKDLDRYLLSDWKPWVDWLALALTLGFFFCTYDFLYPFHLVFYGAQYTRFAPELHSWLWLINLLWYAAALVISLGLIGVTLNRRMKIITSLGQRTLQIYILHRPIRDLLEYAGFYTLFDPENKLSVLLMVLIATLLSMMLGLRFISVLFDLIRKAPDVILKRLHAL